MSAYNDTNMPFRVFTRDGVELKVMECDAHFTDNCRERTPDGAIPANGFHERTVKLTAFQCYNYRHADGPLKLKRLQSVKRK